MTFAVKSPNKQKIIVSVGGAKSRHAKINKSCGLKSCGHSLGTTFFSKNLKNSQIYLILTLIIVLYLNISKFQLPTCSKRGEMVI
jgi:hypothetical protein